MKSATAEKRLKRLVKAAVSEAFKEQKRFIEAAIMEAIEDVGLARAMEEASAETVSRDKIDRLLKRGR
jgi:hypothetical protein